MLSNWLADLGFTRDDLLWWLGKWGAVVILLASFGTDVTRFGIPTSWIPFLQLAALIVGVFSATQQTSDLPGKKMTWLLPLLLAGGLTTGACAGHLSPKQQIDRADRTAYAALRGFQQAETAAYHAKAVWPTPAQHQQIGAKLSVAYQGVIDLAGLGLDIKTGQPLPPQAAKLIADLAQTVVDLTALVSPSASAELQAKVTQVKSTINVLIANVQGATR